MKHCHSCGVREADRPDGWVQIKGESFCYGCAWDYECGACWETSLDVEITDTPSKLRLCPSCIQKIKELLP